MNQRYFLYLLAVFELMRAACALAQSEQGTLPGAFRAQLQRLKIPQDALSVVVYRLDSRTGFESNSALISFNAHVARNPASLMKLMTTSAALDLLGPAFTWSTDIYASGSVVDSELKGNLYIKGQGDPKLGVERLWLLMRSVRGLGIQRIRGDIVLDHQSFEEVLTDPSEFDGEPLRPYNAAADALLINFKSLLINFVPDVQNKVARVYVEPPLAGVTIQSTVPLSGEACTDYRGGLKAELQDPLKISFKGQYPLSCGVKLWPLAYVDPSEYANKAVQAMWSEVGGALSGKVYSGQTPSYLKPITSMESAQLSEVVRDINKYSNNVMAQQLFLTLGLRKEGSGTQAAARRVLEQWFALKISNSDQEKRVIDNGSGLSRRTQMTAKNLADLLAWDYQQPFFSELASSLPLSGVDGTLRLSKSKAHAHLKTGSLKDVAGVAGYVQNTQGAQFILVALINHPLAHTARPLFDDLVEWVGAQP
jgi:D-alanyl-D-alanine carboxypeptidase/D-alanyl-D-alanine-endopeptidase (penicillin-binding protein 4)